VRTRRGREPAATSRRRCAGARGRRGGAGGRGARGSHRRTPPPPLPAPAALPPRPPPPPPSPSTAAPSFLSFFLFLVLASRFRSTRKKGGKRKFGFVGGSSGELGLRYLGSKGLGWAGLSISGL
jgi:hypothetical protein